MISESQAGRLQQQIDFILEIDQLKSILRRSYLLNEQRRENSAEHSWHLAMLAIVLSEYSNEPIDVNRVIKIALLHDVVEIDAGDTFIYDTVNKETQAEREKAAADRIFSLLPEDMRVEMRSYWEEYEEGKTPESKFAAAIDRLMPLLHNYHTKGRSWREHGVKGSQVMQLNSRIDKGSHTLWSYARNLIEQAINNGYIDE